MFVWIFDNLATVIIGIVLAVLVAVVVVKLFRDKRNGKSSCSCGCDGCAMRSNCHKSDNK